MVVQDRYGSPTANDHRRPHAQFAETPIGVPALKTCVCPLLNASVGRLAHLEGVRTPGGGGDSGKCRQSSKSPHTTSQ